MEKEKWKNLEISSLTKEEARSTGIAFLSDSIDECRQTAIVYSVVAGIAILLTIFSAHAANRIFEYGIMGLCAYAINITVRKLFQIAAEKKVLNKMLDNRFEGDYIEFAKDTKAYANKFFK